jgi:hypothetical protein
MLVRSPLPTSDVPSALRASYKPSMTNRQRPRYSLLDLSSILLLTAVELHNTCRESGSWDSNPHQSHLRRHPQRFRSCHRRSYQLRRPLASANCARPAQPKEQSTCVEPTTSKRLNPQPDSALSFAIALSSSKPPASGACRHDHCARTYHIKNPARNPSLLWKSQAASRHVCRTICMRVAGRLGATHLAASILHIHKTDRAMNTSTNLTDSIPRP